MTPEGAIDTAHTWAADAATPAHTRTVLTVLLEHLETVVGDCSDAIDEVTWMQAEIAAVTRHLRAVEHARDVLASALRGSHEATGAVLRRAERAEAALRDAELLLGIGEVAP